jgi:ABC-2 type transport system ATP-binding protein
MRQPAPNGGKERMGIQPVSRENEMIQVESLTKQFGTFRAVNGISFNIARGEILGLLGPNGAGKTTTLRMLTGFLKPTSGTIRVAGQPMSDQGLAVKRMMGYLPESAPLYHDLLVFDYLRYVAEIRGLKAGARTERIRRLAEICQINDVMHKPIGVLSKGYKQRVGLAHAMMSDPQILILDEPTSGLDPNQIVEIREIIRQIGREKTVVLSTHILPEAEATCDRILIIHQGAIVADGATDQIKRSAAGGHRIHLSIANADPGAVRSRLATIDGVAEVITEASVNGVLAVVLVCHGEADLRGPVYREVRHTDWDLLEFYQETQTLETIFRKLTRED